MSESSKEVANTLYPTKNVYISELLKEGFTSFIPLHFDWNKKQCYISRFALKIVIVHYIFRFLLPHTQRPHHFQRGEIVSLIYSIYLHI
jgi:hypothetical protein